MEVLGTVPENGGGGTSFGEKNLAEKALRIASLMKALSLRGVTFPLLLLKSRNGVMRYREFQLILERTRKSMVNGFFTHRKYLIENGIIRIVGIKGSKKIMLGENGWLMTELLEYADYLIEMTDKSRETAPDEYDLKIIYRHRPLPDEPTVRYEIGLIRAPTPLMYLKIGRNPPRIIEGKRKIIGTVTRLPQVKLPEHGGKTPLEAVKECLG